MQIFEEPNVYVILNNNTLYILPKDDKPIRFKSDNYKVQEKDGALVISKQIPLKQAMDRIERAGVDNPYEVVEKLIYDGKCTVTTV